MASMENPTPLPLTDDALVLRTCFAKDEAWKAICDAIRKPVCVGADEFFAYVEFVEDQNFADMDVPELLSRVPPNYPHTFLFVVDSVAIESPESPILVVDLYREPGRTFRTVPSQIQGIENNLSIANMDFESFAECVDDNGVFRDFPGD